MWLEPGMGVPGSADSMKAALPFRILMLLLAAALLLPLGALTAWETHRAIQSGLDASRASSLNLARLAAGHYGQFVRDSETLLRQLARRPGIQAMATGACDPLLDGFHELLPLTTALVLIHPDGRVACSSLAMRRPVSVRDWPSWQGMRTAPALHIAEPVLGPISGLWTVAISLPVIDSAGQTAGRIAMGVRLERFQSVLDTLVLPKGAVITLVSGEGALLARLPLQRAGIGSRVGDREIAEVTSGVSEGFADIRGADGVDRIDAYALVPGSGWYAHAVIPRDAALAAAYATARATALGYLVAGGTLIALLAVAYAWVRRSIEALLAAGGAGGGSRPLAVSGPRELQDAIAAFNSLFEQLRLSDERFRLIGQATNDAVWDWDLASGAVWWNANFQGLFGYRPDQIEPGPESWTGRLHPEDADRVSTGIDRAIHGTGSTWSDEYRFRRADGSYADIFDRGFIIRDSEGRAVRMLGAMQDISERRQQQQRIERLSRMRRVMSSINALIVRTRSRAELFQEACRVAVDQGGFGLAWVGVVRESGELEPVAKAGVDEGYVRRLGFRVDGTDAAACPLIVLAVREERPQRCNDIAGDDSLGAWRAPLRALGFASMVAFPLAAGNRIVGCFSLYSTERDFFDDEEMKLLGELSSDLSYALEFIIKDEQLDFLSIYDPLTQLPNRTLFMRRLPGFIQAAKESGRRLALLILDVERFKAINDALGQAGGDEVLKRIGERLRFHAGGSGYMARVSGDRFAAVITDLAPDADPERVVQRDSWDRFSPPFEQGGQEHLVTFKVGLAVYPQDGADAEALLRNAELALKHGKAGGGRLTRYTEAIGNIAREKQRLNQELRLALERDELALHYQPKIDLRSGAICGAEALLRWNSPERGLVPPGSFIALMEETGLILDVGAWVLERALEQRKEWQREGLAVPRIGVNVSAVQLREVGFVDLVARLLGDSTPDRAGLELEITESTMMTDPEAGTATLRALRGLGVTLAMDDFGTGYSSLSYLARLPLNSLKIDRSFVVGMVGHADTQNIVASIIGLAHSMKLKVVAEGVDSADQVERLRELGCDEVQGYFFGKPVPAEHFARLLREQRML